MQTDKYLNQLKNWPMSGRHIMAQFDDETVIVYQAYRAEIALYAIEHQKFGGEFSFNRMSWIKPNFLWMMYRSGWALKQGQEYILAIKLRREFFNEILCNVVPSTFDSSRYDSREQWKAEIAKSDVRLQWDPDHDPMGNSVERRALQIGLRGEFLRRYGQEEIVSITDITPLVIEQRENAIGHFHHLTIPKEEIYPIDQNIAKVLGI